ncbi:MAG: hypothetical protein AB8G86_23000 [Saprospiraceae bacterium]
MTKQEEYKLLVKKRQEYQFQEGLNNPSKSGYDWNEIEPWAKWQNDLNAKIMLIGQEFSDFDTYKRCKGRVEIELDKYEFPTNKNIVDFFNSIGIEVGHPLAPNKKAGLFFTNCVMGLKNGKMSGGFEDKWMKESRELFLKPLIAIVQPKIIICMGEKAIRSIGKIFRFKYKNINTHANNSPLEIESTCIFCFGHAGGLGLANRPFNKQKEDWLKIKKYL